VAFKFDVNEHIATIGIVIALISGMIGGHDSRDDGGDAAGSRAHCGI